MVRRTPARAAVPVLAFVLAAPAVAGEVPSNVRVQFLPPDARSRGMGGAYTAIADGALATFWNPGALGFVSAPSLLPVSWVRPLPQDGAGGWQYGAAAAFGSDGFGGGLHVSYLAHAERSLPTGSGEPFTWTPADWIAHLGFGVDLTEVWLHGLAGLRWGVGGSLKLVHSFLFPSYGTLKEASATTFDIDLGTLLAYRRALGSASAGRRPAWVELRAGATARNVGDRQYDYGADEPREPLGGGPRAGAAAEVALFDQGAFGHWIRTTGSYELEWFREYRNTAAPGDPPVLESDWFEYADPIRHTGAELSILGILAGRVGHVDGPGGFSGTTWGAGVGAELGERVLGGKFRARIDWARWPSVDEVFDDIDHWSLLVSVG